MKSYRPDWDISTIPEDIILSRAAQIRSSRRKVRGGGAPITVHTPAAAKRRKETREYRERKRKVV